MKLFAYKKHRTWLAVGCSAVFVGIATITSTVVANTSNLFFNVNASDPASYSVDTPTLWTDLSSASRDGEIKGSLTYNSVTQALEFPGGPNSTNSLGYVDMGSGFNDFGNGITIEFEGHFGTVNQNWERIFDFGNGPASDNIWIGVFGESWVPNELAIELWDGGQSKGRCISSGGALTANTFAKYVITMDGSTCRMYKNGDVVHTRVGACWGAHNCSTAAPASTYQFLPKNVTRNNNYIGRSNWGTDAAFNGAIKYVRIYTSALSSEEVADNAITYTLTYATTGADSGTEPASKSGNGLISIDGNTGNLVKAGHTFAGWVTTGSTTALSGIFNLNNNTTLHPLWILDVVPTTPTQQETVTSTTVAATTTTLAASGGSSATTTTTVATVGTDATSNEISDELPVAGDDYDQLLGWTMVLFMSGMGLLMGPARRRK